MTASLSPTISHGALVADAAPTPYLKALASPCSVPPLSSPLPPSIAENHRLLAQEASRSVARPHSPSSNEGLSMASSGHDRCATGYRNRQQLVPPLERVDTRSRCWFSSLLVVLVECVTRWATGVSRTAHYHVFLPANRALCVVICAFHSTFGTYSSGCMQKLPDDQTTIKRQAPQNLLRAVPDVVIRKDPRRVLLPYQTFYQMLHCSDAFPTEACRSRGLRCRLSVDAQRYSGSSKTSTETTQNS